VNYLVLLGKLVAVNATRYSESGRRWLGIEVSRLHLGSTTGFKVQRNDAALRPSAIGRDSPVDRFEISSDECARWVPEASNRDGIRTAGHTQCSLTTLWQDVVIWSKV